MRTYRTVLIQPKHMQNQWRVQCVILNNLPTAYFINTRTNATHMHSILQVFIFLNVYRIASSTDVETLDGDFNLKRLFICPSLYINQHQGAVTPPQMEIQHQAVIKRCSEKHCSKLRKWCCCWKAPGCTWQNSYGLIAVFGNAKLLLYTLMGTFISGFESRDCISERQHLKFPRQRGLIRE